MSSHETTCYFCVFGKEKDGEVLNRSSQFAPPRPLLECTVQSDKKLFEPAIEVLHRGHMVKIDHLLPRQHEALLMNKSPQSACLVYRKTIFGKRTKAFQPR